MPPRTNQLLDAKLKTDSKVNDKVKVDNTPLTAKQKEGWEAYRSYLDKSGLYAHPSLNHKGMKIFNDWAATHPEYQISEKDLNKITNELSEQKKLVLKNLEDKKINLSVPSEEYMTTVQTNDESAHRSYPGTELTQQGFTTFRYDQVDQKGNIKKSSQKGFVENKPTYFKENSKPNQ